MSLTTPIASKAHAVAYFDFCDRHNVEPLDLLASALRHGNIKDFTARSLTAYLVTEQARRHMRAAINECIPDLSDDEVDRFFDEAWTINDQHLFAKRYRIRDVGTTAEFAGRILGREQVNTPWTRESALVGITAGLKLLDESERALYFPFVFMKGRTRSYDAFYERVKRDVRVPAHDRVFRRDRMNFSVQELNQRVASELGIAIPEPETRRQVVEGTKQWLARQNRPPSALRLEDIERLIADKIIRPESIHHRVGLFKGRHNFVTAIRRADGVKRLPVGYRVAKLSDDELLRYLQSAYPHKVNGELQVPPSGDVLDDLAKDRRVPFITQIVGRGKRFSCMRDLHVSMGWPRVRIPHRWSHRNVRDYSRDEGNYAIFRTVCAMAKNGFSVDPAKPYTREDFDRAQKLGIVDHAARIIGREGWYKSDDDFATKYAHWLPSGYSIPVLTQDLPTSEIDVFAEMVMDDVITLFHKDELMSVDEITEDVIARWVAQDKGPTMGDLHVFFGGLHPMKTVMRMLDAEERLYSVYSSGSVGEQKSPVHSALAVNI